MQAGIAGWLAQRRLPRIVLVAGLLPLELLGILSAAIVVMTAALSGWRVAALDCVFALALLGVIFMIGGGPWAQVMINGLATWSIAIVMGSLTGAFGTVTLAIQILLVIAMLGFTVFWISVADPIKFGENFLNQLSAQMAEFKVPVGSSESFLEMAPLVGGVIASMVVLTSIMALFLGNWWAGKVGGHPLGPMFLQLRLGYVIGAIAAVLGITTLVSSGAYAINLLIVLSVGFALQGLAVVHWHIGRRNWPWSAFIPVYGPLLLGNVFMVVNLLLLAAVGFVDNWFNLRPPSRGATGSAG